MEDFFNLYTQAFNTLDANAIASLYRIPCAISDGDGTKVYSELSELTNKFSSNCDALASMGYKHAKFNLLIEQDLGHSAKAVTVSWQIYLENSEIEFRALYICHLVEGVWQIFTVNLYPGRFSDAA